MLTAICPLSASASFINNHMLWPSQNIFTIDIPKTGCQSRWSIGREKWRSQALLGHMSLKKAQYQIKDKQPDFADSVEYWTVIRHPFDRFVSGLNFIARGRLKNRSLDEFLVSSQFRQHFIFRPSFQFLDDPNVEVKLWPMEHLNDMMRELGVRGEIPHTNKSPGTFDRTEIAQRKDIDEIMERYVDDFTLYERAQANFR
jgi:hypothetical protein